MKKIILTNEEASRLRELIANPPPPTPELIAAMARAKNRFTMSDEATAQFRAMFMPKES